MRLNNIGIMLWWVLLRVKLIIINNYNRLWAQDFYEVVVDEAEGRINHHLIEIENK